MEFINPKSFQQIEDCIKQYIKEKRPEINISQINLELTPITGGTVNQNFIIKIISKKDKSVLDKVFYKGFSLKSLCFNRSSEAEIQTYLAEKDIAPKMLYFNEKEQFRIDEYLENCKEIAFEQYVNPNILSNVFNIILTYSAYSNNLYFYEINDTKALLKETIHKKNQIVSPDISLSKTNFNPSDKFITFDKNSFNDTINIFWPCALKAFENFEKDFLNHREDSEGKLKKFKYYLNNGLKFIKDVYKTKGIFILSHTDMFISNFLVKEDKIYVIDNEFMNYNLIGYDILRYLIMKDFVGNHSHFKVDENEIKKYYEIYRSFIKDFLNKFKEIYEDEKEGEIRKFLDSNELFSKEYFFRVLKLIYLNHFISLSTILNYENEFKKNLNPIFYHLSEDIKYFEKLVELSNK